MHIARNFFQICFEKIEICEFCRSLFPSLRFSYHWMGGRGASPRNFNGNTVTCTHVKSLRLIGEHRYDPPIFCMSKIIIANIFVSKIVENLLSQLFFPHPWSGVISKKLSLMWHARQSISRNHLLKQRNSVSEVRLLVKMHFSCCTLLG